jgi:4'-phosphopantetheinyl transferase
MDSPHLFCMAVDGSLLAPKTRFDWLSKDEERLLAAIGSTRRRAQFAAGRWLLHHAAREVFGTAKYRLDVVDERPVVTLEGTRTPAAVSLSHSGDVVVCGLAPSGLLGVDVERVRPRKQWDGLADFALHPDERSRLAELPEAARWQGFYRVWTLKEALAKALGVGLALPFNRISFSAQNRIDSAPADGEFADGAWNFCTPELGAGYAAAAAWRQADS